MNRVPSSESNRPTAVNAPYKLYNIGNNNPVTLDSFIEAIESACARKAVKRLLPMQPGDVSVTFADINSLIRDIDFMPETSIECGMKNFVDWYLSKVKSQ